MDNPVDDGGWRCTETIDPRERCPPGVGDEARGPACLLARDAHPELGGDVRVEPHVWL